MVCVCLAVEGFASKASRSPAFQQRSRQDTWSCGWQQHGNTQPRESPRGKTHPNKIRAQPLALGTKGRSDGRLQKVPLASPSCTQTIAEDNPTHVSQSSPLHHPHSFSAAPIPVLCCLPHCHPTLCTHRVPEPCPRASLPQEHPARSPCHPIPTSPLAWAPPPPSAPAVLMGPDSAARFRTGGRPPAGAAPHGAAVPHHIAARLAELAAGAARRSCPAAAGWSRRKVSLPRASLPGQVLSRRRWGRRCRARSRRLAPSFSVPSFGSSASRPSLRGKAGAQLSLSIFKERAS